MTLAFLEGMIFMTRIEHYVKCKYDVFCSKPTFFLSMVFIIQIILLKLQVNSHFFTSEVICF